jgi:uncharacterized cupin superfamily protein
MPNIKSPEFDDVREHEGFNCRRARLGLQAGAVRVGASLWELPPGQAAYPYHYHLVEEELLIMLEGSMQLRTPDGWRTFEEGEVIAFPVGEAGAHQVVNTGDTTVKFLAISPSGMPEIVVQADASKLGAFERRADGGGIREWYRRADAAPYFEDVPPPEPPRLNDP